MRTTTSLTALLLLASGAAFLACEDDEGAKTPPADAAAHDAGAADAAAPGDARPADAGAPAALDARAAGDGPGAADAPPAAGAYEVWAIDQAGNPGRLYIYDGTTGARSRRIPPPRRPR
jgi:hypothetical protein